MIFWIVALVVAVATAATLLMAVFRDTGGTVSAAASDMSVYRDQLDEVERDLARGVLSEVEAEQARIEVSRRLLDADKRAQADASLGQGGRWMAAVLIPIVLIAGAVGLYSVTGAPGASDLPMKVRLADLAAEAAERPSQAEAEETAADLLPEPEPANEEFLQLMRELRGATAERPNDIQGLTLLARNEARLGNFVAARQAQERLVQVKGEDVTENDLSILIELMLFSTAGYVSPEAEGYLQTLLRMNGENDVGRYFLGLLFAQTGRHDQAFPVWRRLLEESPANAPWVPVILSEIEAVAAAAGINYQAPRLRGPDAGAIAAAQDMSEGDRAEMIRGMVEGLSSRLAEEGGSPEEWVQLINALMVLGEEERAKVIYAEAKSVFGQSEDAMRLIYRTGIDKGLE